MLGFVTGNTSTHVSIRSYVITVCYLLLRNTTRNLIKFLVVTVFVWGVYQLVVKPFNRVKCCIYYLLSYLLS